MAHTTTGGLRLNLYKEILNTINRGTAISEDEFNDLALRVFRYQLSANAVYRGYFDAARYSRPDHWKQIPALPAAAFKRTEVRSFPADAMLKWFQTSGTTEEEAGRHYFETLDLYEAAIAPTFKRYLLPDKERMRMEILTPSPQEMPHSSLVHMMDTVLKRYGTPQSAYHIRGGELDFSKLRGSLEESLAAQQPVFLLGTAFAFVYAIEEMARGGVHLNLPFGSRIMETGGFKGRVKEIPRAQFYDALSDRFGVPLFNIVNEYGMTELSSQFYDKSLRDQVSTDWKVGSDWCRTMIVSPDTGEEQAPGIPGLIRILDLANAGSVISLQTEDVGISNSSGEFRVLGRVGSASLRGCSLTSESLLI